MTGQANWRLNTQPPRRHQIRQQITQRPIHWVQPRVITNEQSQTQLIGENRNKSEQDNINSGDSTKAEVFDVLTDNINNFATKNEGTKLSGTIDGTNQSIKATMKYDFFADTAKREVAAAREEAMKRATKSVPQ